MNEATALLTVDEYAAVLGVSATTIRKAMARGTLRHTVETVPDGYRVRVPVAFLERRSGQDRRQTTRQGHDRRGYGAVPKIPCPKCAESDSSIIESRASLQRQGVRRRRLCRACAHRFTTIELIDHENNDTPDIALGHSA